MLKSEINTETAGKCESSIVCRLSLMYCICIIGNWKILASIFGGHFSGTPSVHLKTPELQGKCPCSWLGPSTVLLHPWTPSSLSDLGGKLFLELVMIAGSYLPGESFLDGQPHAIRFSYFGEVPECLTLKDHIEVYVRKLIVVIQIISLSFIDYRDVEDTKHPKHTYSSSP